MKENIFGGVIAKLPVPMERDGGLDLFALMRILEKICSSGVSAALLYGRERAYLKPKERRALIGAAAEYSSARASIYCTVDPAEGERAIEEAEYAGDAGANGVILAPCPPGTPGLCSFIRALGERVPLPICVVKPAGRRTVPLYAELCDLESVLAVALTSYDPSEGILLCRAFGARGRSVAGAPRLIAASDPPFLSAPDLYDGFLSALPAVFPRELQTALKKEGVGRAEALSSFLEKCDLFSGDEGEANQKWALHRQGLCLPTLRLPLREPDAQTCAAISRAVGC